ncbi:hypothetical protein AX14_011472 [Amanita brunnescens Koide BX004]|nr:hypothetical protein AX14_011472 [Amanita brunnescens Koide BX004]
MVRAPLNVIATWIVQIIQTGIALKRISVYLGKDEVSAQVSSLKAKSPSQGTHATDGLGLQNASFKWNQVEQPDNKNAKAKAKALDLAGSPLLAPDSASSISMAINQGSPSIHSLGSPRNHALN